ncbi:MAG: translation initiation factor IF-2 subunit gamma [Nanoarchaeota archaeon]|nr:translation initiation factor IF-2 subunit gamma [Nanoarchaeota archaeon]
MSGKWTDTHSEELKKGITIRLGYADSIFYYCKKCKKYTVKDKCDCKEKTELKRKVSFVDAPGHESLMATMLAGAMIMDGAILLVSAAETCPQPQTREHLMALEIIGVKNLVVVQNKIDLVTEEEAIENYKQIQAFLKGTTYKKAPIIPISARSGANIDVLIEAIEKAIPPPKRDPKAKPMMLVARSFDVNKPGTKIKSIIGGILGGAIKQGVLKTGEEVEIKPGRMIEEKNKKVWYPLTAKITGLQTGGQTVDQATPGGSIGVLTSLDPAVVKSDSLAGSVIGHPGTLPEILYNIILETNLLDRVVGLKEELKVKPITKKEILMLNVNSAATVGVVTDLKKDTITCILKKPICAEKGDRVTISRRVGTVFRLIGYGVLK